MNRHITSTIIEDRDDEESSSEDSQDLVLEQQRRPVQDNRKTIIKRFVVMGDSLSDRGFMDSLTIGGVLPMDILSGLKGISPDRRFTNGYVWVDELASLLATDFKIARIQRMAKQSDKQYLDLEDNDRPRYDDIYDGLLANDHKLKAAIGEDPVDCLSHSSGMKRSMSDSNIEHGKLINRMKPAAAVPHGEDFTLDDYLNVTYHGKTWLRSYCQGGLMAYDYAWKLSTSISRFFSRTILATLEDMRRMMMSNDREMGVSWREKQETMVIEWSGANDMITVNREPSIEIANKAVAARMKNMRKMIHAGYRNFTLFNLPDMSLTPRYQARSLREQRNASRCSDHFNNQLATACAQMALEFPECTINVYDINSSFRDMYHNPEQYGFEQEKQNTPYTESEDFHIDEGSSPSRGYMFWDDVHPTADVHALNGRNFYEWLTKRFRCLEPDSQLCNLRQESADSILQSVRKSYQYQLTQDRSGMFFCLGGRSRLDYKHASLVDIFDHALYNRGTRTKEVLIKLGLLDKHGQPVMEIPVVADVMHDLALRHDMVTNDSLSARRVRA
ncbi:SGNH/GDSL hydrolase family protein [Legionella sp. CNM-4043-24]|uniref:SGNH/GDSL hydrolase family protein n=1 Tax=Legionella sp. CNM-4043-24 TaxID=3421646 RepID=UPI00403B2C24